jgi:hypothetical protein
MADKRLRAFYAIADQIADPRHRQSAYVVAEDETEALALLTADERFSGYHFPPSELSTDPGSDTVAAALKKLGVDKLEKGVFGVGFVGPVDWR